ncbi:hypothetical protein Pyn_03009 [Prunus yedoensis var. nudiflora]|uniref:Uncharacterized protein n=1 Tax=Prunus yedoensis var. nudiflora TaxID=2094558 RepID=A0A314V0D3_PRUYE|nr:hypothetical protein Pyn_03009 [Prunus yedoensis var. nudiflora]
MLHNSVLGSLPAQLKFLQPPPLYCVILLRSMAPCWLLMQLDFGISLKHICHLLTVGEHRLLPLQTALRVPLFFVLGVGLMLGMLGFSNARAAGCISFLVATRAFGY